MYMYLGRSIIKQVQLYVQKRVQEVDVGKKKNQTVRYIGDLDRNRRSRAGDKKATKEPPRVSVDRRDTVGPKKVRLAKVGLLKKREALFAALPTTSAHTSTRSSVRERR